MSRRIAITAGLLFIAVAVGYDLYRQGSQPRERSFVVRVDRASFTGPITVLVDGREVATLTGDAERAIGHDQRPEAEVPQLDLRGLFPCGWKTLPLATPTLSEAVPNGTNEYPYKLTIGSDIRGAQILVDNRNGPAADLRIGERSIQVAADTPVKDRIDLGDCAAPDMTLAGTALGPLEVNEQSHVVLIDPTASRCYEIGTVVYGEALSYDSSGKPLGIPDFERVSGSFPAKRVQPLPAPVQYFLVPAPEKVEGYMGQFFAQQWLMEIDCG